jgi:hypothetical protein
MGRREIKLHFWLAILAAIALAATPQKAEEGKTGFPFEDESLHYNVNWPSGLALGEANLTAHRTGNGWDLEMTLDAGIPAFRISDHFHSVTNTGICSLEFERQTSHGSKNASEKTSFNYAKGVAHRVSTGGGGESDLAMASNCAHDALAFLFAARRDLSQGSLGTPSEIFFGPSYSIRLENAGQQTIPVGGKPVVSDRVSVHLKGPASSSDFEIFFGRDAARTPLMARIPTALGTMSVELSR